jgi:hypothetical protein
MTGNPAPLPASVAIATLDLTDEQRLAVCRELWILHNTLRNAHIDQTLHTFERLARERLERGTAAAE